MTQFSRLGLLLVTSMIATACSSGGGSSNASTGGRASGPLSVPDATCDGAPCMGGASLTSTASLIGSGEVVLTTATDVYTYFSNEIIPAVNSAMYRVEKVAAENDLTTCAAIEGVTAGVMDYPLGDGYTVDISDAAGIKNIPDKMVGVGNPMTKRFVFSNSGTKFAEVQIKCNGTERTFYVRVQESASKIFEFWTQDNGVKKTIYGAMDDGSAKISFYFNTADGTKFELHGVANQVMRHGAATSFAIAGGADLTAGKLDVASIAGGATTVPTNVGAVPYAADTTPSPADVRHCYSSLEPATIDADGSDCVGLLSAAGAAATIRSGTAWSMNGMQGAIDTAF